MKFLLRLFVTALALWIAVALIPGIVYAGPPVGLLAVALVFGAVNAVVRPLLLVLTCPLVLLTLGLFVFVLNGIMLWLTASLSGALGLGFTVSGLLPAVLGALVIGLVSTVLNVFVAEAERDR